MNDSLDLRNRILKMRESNNLIVTKTNSSKNNLMSKFESSIKDDNLKKPNSDKDTILDKNKETVTKSLKNNYENLVQNIDKSENKNSFKNSVNENEAQFLMLANKFNEAVEVILELSERVERLEKNTYQNLYKTKKMKNYKPFLKIKLFTFFLIIPIIILAFFTFPIDLSIIKLILIDVFSKI